MERIRLDRPRDVLEVLPAQLAVPQFELPFDLIQDLARNADPSPIGDPFKPGCHVDSIAEDVAAVLDDVSDIDADAKLDALFRRHLHISFDHASLNFDGTVDGIHNASKLDEHAVAAGIRDV